MNLKLQCNFFRSVSRRRRGSCPGRSYPKREKTKKEVEIMKKRFRITAADKAHFESLIFDYENSGFILSVLEDHFAILESADSTITIEY
jgi:hypothetical protein